MRFATIYVLTLCQHNLRPKSLIFATGSSMFQYLPSYYGTLPSPSKKSFQVSKFKSTLFHCDIIYTIIRLFKSRILCYPDTCTNFVSALPRMCRVIACHFSGTKTCKISIGARSGPHTLRILYEFFHEYFAKYTTSLRIGHVIFTTGPA